MEEKIECSICFKTIEPHPNDTRQWGGWMYGNNPDPITKGRCCDTCDCLIVIPARMGMQGAMAIEFGQVMLKNRINPPDFEKIKKDLIIIKLKKEEE